MGIKHLLAALIALAPVAALAGQSNPPGAPLNGFGKVRAPSQYQPAWRPASARDSYPNQLSSAAQSLIPAQMSRLLDQIPGRSPISAIQLCYDNFEGKTINATYTSEADALSPITITASIEINTIVTTGTWQTNAAGIQIIPETFNGNMQVTISPGGRICSDPIVYPFAANQNFYDRTYYSVSGMGPYPVIRGFDTLASFTEGVSGGYFVGATVSSSSTPTTSIAGTVTTGASQPPVVLPLVPGSLGISGGTITGTASDNGSGVITGGGVTGTINYTTGAIALTLTTAAAPNAIRVSGFGNAGTTAPNETLTGGLLSDLVPTAPVSGVYGPSEVYGLLPSNSTIAPKGICVFGDSIDWGAGNTTQPGQSWIVYSSPQVGLVRMAQPSDKAAAFAQPQFNRRRLGMALQKCDVAIDNYGTNDIDSVPVPSLATLESVTLANWATIAAIMPDGYKDIYPVSILPRTTSASSQTPITADYGPGTVASGNPSLRNAFNAWLCAEVPALGMGGFIDTASVIEGNPATCAGAGDGTWKSLTYTFDGTHPTYLGDTTIAGVLGYGGTNQSSAFVP